VKPLTDISVSSIQDFQKCPLRWCFKYLEERVPRYEPTAFTVGKMVHKAFEIHFENPDTKVGWALGDLIADAKDTLLDERETKAIAEVEQLKEPLEHWSDFYPIEETLEVETPHSIPLGSTRKELKEYWNLDFKIKPDRVVRIKDTIYHMQHKTISAQRDLATFVEVASHSFHELLYARVLQMKYPNRQYGGSIFNIVRKLQYKSYAKDAVPGKRATKAKAEEIDALPLLTDKERETKLRTWIESHRKILHEPHEFFSQWMVSITPPHIETAVNDLYILARQMKQVADDYWAGDLPPCNRQQDEDMFTRRTDPYFDVIMGLTSLEDDTRFMDRVDHYEEVTQ
jgi:hypothetical protein